MPEFGMRYVKCAEYINTAGVITHGTMTAVGDAMTANLELRFAEARLYAEDQLAEYLRKPLGGSISIGVKYIKDDAKKLMFGVTEKSRTISNTAVKSLLTTAKDVQKEVALAFYCPSMIDGAEKYVAVFIHRARFGQPSMTAQTLGESVTFQTPTTVGEFLPDHTSAANLMETYVADTTAAAEAWIGACLG